MSCLDEFITQRYDDILSVCRTLVKSDAEDLCNDLCLQLLSDREKYEEICKRGELWFYVKGSVSICRYSKKTSHFYKYKHPREKEKIWKLDRFEYEPTDWEQINEREDKLEFIEKNLKKMTWFDRELTRVYYHHNHSLRTLSDETKIHYQTVHQAIRRVKSKIRKAAKRNGY